MGLIQPVAKSARAHDSHADSLAPLPLPPRRWLLFERSNQELLVHLIGWAAASVLATVLGSAWAGLATAFIGLIALGVLESMRRTMIQQDWRMPLRQFLRQLLQWGEGRPDLAKIRLPNGSQQEWIELARTLNRLGELWGRSGIGRQREPIGSGSDDDSNSKMVLTRSGMSPCLLDTGEFLVPADSTPSAIISQRHDEMINRLHPVTFAWLDSSPAEQRFLGYPLEQLKAHSFLEVVHRDDRELARQQLTSAIEKGEAHGLVYRIKNARRETLTIELHVGVRYGTDGQIAHLRCLMNDITSKVHADRELRRRTRELIRANENLLRANRDLQELKDRYSDLYQNAPVMYFTMDDRSVILDCNDTMLRILGYSRDELVGRQYLDVLDPERHGSFQANYAIFLQEGMMERASRWRKAGGEFIDVWLKAKASTAAPGKPSFTRVSAEDVTARNQLQDQIKINAVRLQVANAELSRKNHELDEFSHVVSHDLQEPVRTLIAFSEFLLTDHADRLGEEGQQHVRYIIEASRRMRALIQALLELSRAGKIAGAFAAVDPRELISRIEQDFDALLRAKHGRIVVAHDLPILWGDLDRLGQLFANLINNALKYNTNEHPRVEVSLEERDPQGWCTIRVSDNGIGIDPQYHSKIFQMFAKLHPRDQFEGTGAGLAICQKIVEAHGGTIQVESERGKGASFLVTLPLLPVDEGPASEFNGNAGEPT